MELLSLPPVILENIISYLNHDEIAKNRVICRDFNEICMRLLNHGFHQIERRHSIALKVVKTQLPRRESERRYHPLARHCDILSSIETRISMLNMTYSKFIDSGLCCFIPGKVIDEIKRVLKIVETMECSPPRTHEVLQELRDISSMAIEHFDEKISPALRKKLANSSNSPSTSKDNALTSSAIKQELTDIRRRSLVNAKLSLYLASQYKKFYKRMLMYRRISLRQRKTIRDMTQKQTEQDAAIADLKRRIEECDIKYSELTHTNQAAGGKSIAASTVTSPQPLRHFASQIKLDLSVLPIGTSSRSSNSLPNMKPRKPRIKLPSLSEDAGPPPKKPKPEQPHPNRASLFETRAINTMAKIRTYAQEIRNLTSDDLAGSSNSTNSRDFGNSTNSRDFGNSTDSRDFGNSTNSGDIANTNSGNIRVNKRSVSFSALDDEIGNWCSKKQKLD